jgi:hypothetical protein
MAKQQVLRVEPRPVMEAEPTCTTDTEPSGKMETDSELDSEYELFEERVLCYPTAECQACELDEELSRCYGYEVWLCVT